MCLCSGTNKIESTMANEARYGAKLDALRRVLSEVASSSSKEMMEKIAVDINAAFDKLYLHKPEGSIEPTRGQMIEYVQQAIKDGHSSYYNLPDHGIGWLSDECLKVEHGAAWEFFNMDSKAGSGGVKHDMNNTAEEIKIDALSAMQDYFPNGGRDWDAIGALYDAIAAGKITGLSVNMKIHDHACTNCFSDQGPCLGECAVSDENALQRNGFEESATPLIKWMAENVNPHHKAVVDSTSAELLSSEISVKTEAHLKD